MKNLLFFLILFSIATSTIGAATSQDLDDVVGNWKYEVPSAPYGYDKGNLIIEKKDDELAGEVVFADGYKIDLKNVTYENGEFKCGLYIDYEYISITAKIEGDKMTGTANTPEGELKITAEKQK